MKKRHVVDYYVLESLIYDIESYPLICQMINSDHAELEWKSHYGGRVPETDILAALVRCVRSGLVEACVETETALVGCGDRVVPDVPLDRLWYRLTDAGSLVVDNWDPEASKPRRGGS